MKLIFLRMGQVQTFLIRKCSIFEQSNRWRHFPQRSSLTFHLISEKNGSGVIMVYWRGDSLTKTYWNATSFLSSTACYPSLALKQVLSQGEVVQRIQVDFIDLIEFDRCCDAIKRSGLSIKLQEKRAQDELFSQPSSQLFISESQTSNSMKRVPTQTPESQTNVSTDFSQRFCASQGTQKTDNLVNPLILKPREESPSNTYPGLNDTPFNLWRPIDPVPDYSLLTNTDLKALINYKLKQRSFIDLVNRVDCAMIEKFPGQE